MRETQGAAAELASDGRSGRTRSTTRTDCEEEEEAALAIGERSTAVHGRGGGVDRDGARFWITRASWTLWGAGKKTVTVAGEAVRI